MKNLRSGLFLFFLFGLSCAFAQTNPVIDAFPKGTVLHGNIPYNNDTLRKHLLDIYLPPNANEKLPLVIFIHGGGWLVNDKYADIGYMKKTVAEIISSGFALASIDYRFATQAIFPAQIQDCNRAVSFLYDNADKYGFDKKRFALMGFSAGGHLASLVGLSKNNNVENFFMKRSSKAFNFKAVVDFYGPAELILFPGANDEKSPEAQLIGATPLSRPDLAKAASPVAYVDKNDPPFLIIHGEKDDMVAPKQSELLSAWLRVVGVQNELIIVKDAPHFGVMFDADEVRNKVMSFLKHLNYSLALRKYSSERLVLFALTSQSVFGIVLVGSFLVGWADLSVTLMLIFLFLCCQGFIFPNASALSLAAFGHNAGSASALLGAVQLSIGAAASALVSFLQNGTSLSMAGVMAGCPILSLTIFMLGRKIKIRQPTRKEVEEEDVDMINSL